MYKIVIMSVYVFMCMLFMQANRHTDDYGAFYVTLQQDNNVTYGNRVVFDTVIYNPPGDYDTNSGLYRCPNNGIYVMFSTITTTEDLNVVSLALLRNGTRRKPTLIGRNQDDQFFSGSTMWVFECSAGDQVGIQMYWAHSGTGLSAKGDGFTTFSGFKLVNM